MPRARRVAPVSLVVLLVTLVLGVAGAELAVRQLEPVRRADLLPLPYAPETARFAAGDTYIRFDAELGWTTGKGASARAGDVTYRANGAGFRADREYEVEPPSGIRRMAAFGDSFAHCDEVDYRDCWTARLEALSEGAEVLNFGIPGSSADQGWLRYRRDARPYRPCAVLIGFQVENVNRVVNRFRPFYAPTSGLALAKPRFVLDGDGLRLVPSPVTTPELLDDPAWVEEHLGPGDFWYYPGMYASRPLDGLIVARMVRTTLYQRHRAAIRGPIDDARPNGSAYTADDERFQVAGRVLREFAREVGADGATPVVVFFGQRQEVVKLRHDEPREYRPLLDWLERDGIAAIDVTGDLAREANRSGVDPLFARGGHYSRRGNEVVGAGLARRLPSLTASTCG